MENQALYQLFPAFGEIADETLREQAMETMRAAMLQGGWNAENILLCPVTLNYEGCDVSWVEHVTDVAKACIQRFDQVEKYYKRHGVPVSRDLVAAGALLHDIGKLTEFVCVDGTPVHGPNYQLMRHPLSGALIASKAGLPDEVVHLVATHSFEGDKSYQTVESELVRTIDMFVFQCSVKGLKKRSE